MTTPTPAPPPGLAPPAVQAGLDRRARLSPVRPDASSHFDYAELVEVAVAVVKRKVSVGRLRAVLRKMNLL